MEAESESTRADLWLWACRLFKTRSQAAKACAAGKVMRGGQPLKPATPLRAGDRIELPFPEGPGLRLVEVLRPIRRRVSAAEARDCVADHTPPEVYERHREEMAARKDAGPGRPTKRDRRELERFRGFFD